jgi:hypothetical protein
MRKAQLGQTCTHEFDNATAALPTLPVLGQQVLQFEGGTPIAAARAIIPDRDGRERSDRGARLGIDAQPRQMAQPDDGAVGEPRPAAESLFEREMLGGSCTFGIDPRPQPRNRRVRRPKEVRLARECPQGVPQRRGAGACLKSVGRRGRRFVIVTLRHVSAFILDRVVTNVGRRGFDVVSL